MTHVKHFYDSRWLTSNAGYKNLETQINEFIKDITSKSCFVVDIKYGHVFNPVWSNQDEYNPSHGISQFSALLIFEDGRRSND